MSKIVKLVREEDDLMGRSCELRPNAKEVYGFQVAKRGKSTGLESAIMIDETGGRAIAEYYVPLSLDKLREIDNDKEKLKDFLTSRLPRIKTGSTINMLVVKLVVEGTQRITSSDIDYVWDMLQVSGNDILAPPLVAYPKGTPNEMEEYSSVVKEFLQRASSAHHERMACSIPYSASRGDVADITSLFADVGPQVYVLDFGGKKPFDSAQEMIMSALFRIADRSAKESNRDFYLYALDVKPFKSGADTTVAENIMLAGAGFNAVGPRHTVPPMKPEVLARLAIMKPNPLDRTKVFIQSDLGYHIISERGVKGSFTKWMGTMRSDIDVSTLEKPENDEVTRSLARAYSYAQLIPGARLIDQGIERKTLKSDLDSKVLPQEVVKRIQKIKKETRSSKP